MSFSGGADTCVVIVGLDETGTVDDRDGLNPADGSDVDICAGNDVVDCTRDGEAHAGGVGDVTGCSAVTGDTLCACNGVFSKGDVWCIIGVSQRGIIRRIRCYSMLKTPV